MRAYLIRRLLLAVPTLLIVTITVFLLVRFIPGTALDMMVAEMSATAGEELKDVSGLKHALGLDVSIPVQYGRWLGVWPGEDGKIYGMLQGNLGKSLWTNERVVDIYRTRLPVSIELSLITQIIMLSLALPIGVFMATKQDSVADYTGRLFAIIMMSLPGFWLMTMVIVYPSIWWGTMPNIVYVPLVQDPFENLKQFILPAALGGIAGSAGMMRLVRTMMLEVMRQDYIRTAWSKGLTERVVLMRHALKNAFIPVITVLGGMLPALLGGQVITEQIFALPGVGRVFLNALNQRDYPLISASNTIIAGVSFLSIILVDISYAWFDPRIRYK
jgi:peptide/nickel transport system permease protein